MHRVEPIRDGRSFSTRSVVSAVEGKETFRMNCSLPRSRAGGRVPAGGRTRASPRPVDIEGFEAPFPFDIRELGHTEQRSDGTYLSTRRCWFRTREPLPDDPAVHACVLAYFSDMTGAAFRPLSLGVWGTHTDTSLDHALWFHRPWRADAWSLFDLHALVNAGGRSTIRATMHGEDGTLHLSMAQELLIRELDEPMVMPETPPWLRRAARGEASNERRGPMGLLEGQRAVVTGGGSGIGRATCRRMAEEGATGRGLRRRRRVGRRHGQGDRGIVVRRRRG